MLGFRARVCSDSGGSVGLSGRVCYVSEKGFVGTLWRVCWGSLEWFGEIAWLGSESVCEKH